MFHAGVLSRGEGVDVKSPSEGVEGRAGIYCGLISGEAAGSAGYPQEETMATS